MQTSKLISELINKQGTDQKMTVKEVIFLNNTNG